MEETVRWKMNLRDEKNRMIDEGMSDERDTHINLNTEEIKQLRLLENNDKEERKNNIVIKGLEAGEDVKEDTKRFLKNLTGRECTLLWARKIGKDERNMIVAKMGSWEEKQAIMKKKKQLGNSRIFIDHDLSQKERKIQSKILKRVKEEKSKGKVAKCGYQKINLEGKWFR